MHPPQFFTLLTVVPFINAAPYTLPQIVLASAVPEVRPLICCQVLIPAISMAFETY